MGLSFKTEKKQTPVAAPSGAPTQSINTTMRTSAPDTSKVPFYIHLLKIISVLVLLAVILGSLYLKIDLDPNNKFLAILGYENNTETDFKSKKTEQNQKQSAYTRLDKRYNDLAQKIKDKNYSEYTPQIEAVRSHQITWFDKTDKNNVFHIGLFNTPDHLSDYVNNEQLYTTLGAKNNTIKIENITANRNSLNFAFESSNLEGKVFNLTNEFIKLINSFPNLEGVQISSFTRSKNDIGLDSMNFSVNAKTQGEETVDVFDDEKQYKKFLEWVGTQNTTQNTPSTSTTRPRTTPTRTPSTPKIPSPGLKRN